MQTEPVHDHVCWGFQRRDEFTVPAWEFLADGLTAHERVLYVAPGDPELIAAQMRAAGPFGEGLRTGAVQISSADATYATGAVVDPAGQVELYATATAQALAEGYTGLRVAADVTPLVRTPAQLDAFARYEHLVDHFMAAHPMSAICGYDTAELGDETVAQLACMHPEARQVPVPFHLHGHTRDGSAAALAGELDMRARPLWPLALQRAQLRPAGGSIAIDATDLTFIDHRSLFDIADYAEATDTTVVLRTRLSTPARLLELFGLTNVRVERV
ncbi:MEDS domain-containing protein [Amycolatopsis plumensis]|uniref:MEDS domain-containing protein n=1 Tax=Amycolatopsis plumensis TaxID=236508 RepID=A0ABV5TYT5_9PSEU